MISSDPAATCLVRTAVICVRTAFSWLIWLAIQCSAHHIHCVMWPEGHEGSCEQVAHVSQCQILQVIGRTYWSLVFSDMTMVAWHAHATEESVSWMTRSCADSDSDPDTDTDTDSDSDSCAKWELCANSDSVYVLEQHSNTWLRVTLFWYSTSVRNSSTSTIG